MANPRFNKQTTNPRGNTKREPMKSGGSTGLWDNINNRKKLGISRSKKNSTISDKAYKNMQAGFKNKKKKKEKKTA